MGSQYQRFLVYGRNCRNEISTSALASRGKCISKELANTLIRPFGPAPLPEREKGARRPAGRRKGWFPNRNLRNAPTTPSGVYDSEEFRDQDGPAYVRNGRLQRWIPTHYGLNALVQRRETSVQSSWRQESFRKLASAGMSQTVLTARSLLPDRLRLSLSASLPLRRPRWTA
jgi:hypothetical protein